jgi:hypothetical protein
MGNDFKGSRDALRWLDNFKFKRNQGFLMQPIYNFFIWRRLINSCNEEQIDLVQSTIAELNNFESGLAQAIVKLQMKQVHKNDDKEAYIRKQLSTPTTSFQDIEEEILERERWSRLTPDQIAIKNARWMGPGEIPYDLSWEQPKLYQHTDSFGVTAIIFDKVYGWYTGTVYSPRGLNADGHQDVRSIRSRTWGGICGIRAELDRLVKLERADYAEYQKEMETLEKGFNRKSRGGNVDISKVEKFMGLSDQQKKDRGLFNNDLNGDIF